MAHVVKLIGTFFYTGFFPIAPATFASGVFALIYALVPGGEWLVHPVVCAVTLVVSVPVSTRLEKEYGEDPGCVVIDEVVGMQLALVWTSAVTGWGVFATFFVFRVFDVLKPFPANRSQRLPGGWGVVADDVIAGLYTRVALIAISSVLPRLGVFI
jgi:phosphatidylglycerophosphatase A